MTARQGTDRQVPPACVLGDMDVVRPLAMAGVRSWVAGPPRRPPRFSRFVDGTADLPDPWEEPERVVENLTRFARQQPAPPVLFYEDDGFLTLVSRYRRQLAESFRFVVPDAALVEDLVDKARFLDLANRLDLPVPPSRRLPSGTDELPPEREFPLIIKPLTRSDRDGGWATIGHTAKAVRVDSPADFRALLPRLRSAGICLLAQSLVPGEETAVESYHVYARRGQVVGDFTGRKLRTLPAEFGFSTALTTSHSPDLVELGRTIVARLDLDGVAKLDFKRAPDGTLYLLEINPRFTLWNHLGARAGVNLPWLVYADLMGLETGPPPTARPGVTWCDIPKDFRAVGRSPAALAAWLRFAATADIKTDLSWDDPGPFLRGRVLPRLFRPIRSDTTDGSDRSEWTPTDQRSSGGSSAM